MSRDDAPLIDRIPGMVWFFAGMLLASLVVGVLLTIAHQGFVPEPSAPLGQRAPTQIATADCNPRASHVDASQTDHCNAPESTPKPAEVQAITMAETALETMPPSAGPLTVAAEALEPLPSANDIARQTRQAIRSTLESWTVAWSGKDMPRYLAQYHADFTPEGGDTRENWIQQRHRRIAGKPGRIAVFLREIDIHLDNETATATFVQDYDSDTYRDSTRKRLTLAKSALKWRILREEPID